MNACGHGLIETQFSRDIGAPLAAGLHQLCRKIFATGTEVENAAKFAAQVFILPGVAKDKAGELQKILCVDGLEVLLYQALVGPIELPEARGIAAATGILEQDGIIEISEGAVVEPKLAANMHADPGTAQGVTRRLTFGQVQGEADGTNDFRQRNCWSIYCRSFGYHV